MPRNDGFPEDMPPYDGPPDEYTRSNESPNGTMAMPAIPGPANSEATKVEQSRAVAEVQAAIVAAKAQPRSVSVATRQVMDSCKMRGLAERAFYRYSRGGSQITGPSIHLAVELARCWGNIAYGVNELSRNDDKGESEMRAYARDLETNATVETTFIVPHKRDKRGGAVALTDMRDIYENNANNAARRLRECIFRVLPPWLVEEAKAACHATIEHGGGVPLDQRRAKCLAAFERLFVTADQIEARIGRPVDKLTAADLAQLEVSYRSITRGEIDKDEEFPPQTARKVEENLRGGGKSSPPENKPAETKPDTPKETKQGPLFEEPLPEDLETKSMGYRVSFDWKR